MTIANLMISVFVTPLFNLVVSLKALVLVILVESVVIFAVSKIRGWTMPAFVLLANVASTAAGLLLVHVLPDSLHVTTDSTSLDSWRIPAVLAGYLICLAFSVAIEGGVYRVVAIWSRVRISFRPTIYANALSYTITPIFMWLYWRAWLLLNT